METTTTNNKLQLQALQEARRLGDELLQKAKESPQGLYWESFTPYSDTQTAVSENIYSGNSGTVLFLIELFKLTQEEKYLQAAKSATNWILHYCQQNPPQSYAFLTGRIGVAFLMLRWYDLTAEHQYLEYALQFTEGCEDYLNNPVTIDDLINGASGILLCLLHVHSYTADESVLEKIRLFTTHLLAKAQFGEKGIFWDGKKKSVRGLCGFSHGAAGLGFVFGELGYYFQNPAFYWLAEQAYAYENNYFDHDRGNWMDFRKSFFDDETLKEQQTAFREKNLKFFTEPSNMAAWCHGAPGIGLSRIRAAELIGDKYLEDLDKALLHTKEVTVDTSGEAFTLCHGRGGNAMLFLEAYKIFQKKEYLEWAEMVVRQALEHIGHSDKGYMNGFGAQRGGYDDSSLFMGNAGIGYFYLEVLAPHQVPSVLYTPLQKTVENSQHTFMGKVTETELKSRLLSGHFPRTFRLLEKNMNYKQALQAALPTFGSDTSAVDWLKESLASFASQDAVLQEIFTLEATKHNLFSCANYPFLTIRNMEARPAKLLEQNSVEFKKLYLRTDEFLESIEVNFCWRLHQPEKWGEKGEQEVVVLRAQEGKVQEYYEVSDLVKELLNFFRREESVQDCLETFKKYFEITSVQEREQYEALMISQIKELLISGFLLPADCPSL
jgi:hypothetical protein